MSFVLSKSIKPSKIFLTRKAEMTDRWDPSYFRPELVALEKRVRSVTPNRLRDFALRIAGGATPSTKENDTHYTESPDGVPFIRVQNLSTTGRLNLEDCKRITRSTHEGLLGRSKLSGGELLVKITGVGRMAVASVVPDNFEANINQHIVAIRTEDRVISETLAAWLNLDSAERLASRRATGGTRPALDYPALLSIPIIADGRLPKLIGDAVTAFQARLNKANELMASVDEVILTELGIVRKNLPANTIENRIYRKRFSVITGGRLNPEFYRVQYERRHAELDGCPYPVVTLGKLQGSIFQGVGRNLGDSSHIQLLKVKNISRNGDIDFTDTEPVMEVPPSKVLKAGDIISPFIGAAIKQYKFAMFTGSVQSYAVDNNTGVIRIRDERVMPNYLLAFCRSEFVRWQLDQLTGGGGVPFLGAEYARQIRIVLPPKPIQARICKRVEQIRAQAAKLRADGEKDFEDSKRGIEALILDREVGK